MRLSAACRIAAVLVAMAPAGAATARAAEAARPPDYIAALERRIDSGEFANLHSVVVNRGGKTIFERYLEGTDDKRGQPLGTVKFGPDMLHDVRSVSKSIVSLLFGIAAAEGAIPDLDKPVLDYFPEYPDLRTAERLRIRLRDILSMTSGLHWDERTYPYTDVRNSETAMDRASDRYHFILSAEIDAAPGARFNYSGGDVALAAQIVARATKTPIDRYVAQKLFAPLGIAHFEWLKDQSGIPLAASGLRLLPADMAAIGRLMLQHGMWNGKAVVPAAWVDDATALHIAVQPGRRCGPTYGYLWWRINLCTQNQETPLYFATGNGGQNIWVVPSLDLVVVTTAGQYNTPKGDEMSAEITKSIVEALR